MASNPVPSTQKVYDSDQRPHPLVEETLALFRYRELIRQFVARAIKIRYKRSILGVFWTMLNPLLTMLVLTLIFSRLFRFSVENYPVYVLSGLVLWNFFSASTSAAMSELLWSGSLLQRIYVPKAIFAVSAVGSGLVNLLLSLLPLLLIVLVSGGKLTPALLALPAAILLLAIFTLGLGLLLSTAATYFADTIPVYEVVLMIWLYLTPVFYPADILPDRLAALLQFNPISVFLTLFRQPIYAGVIPGWNIWLAAAGFAFAALLAGGALFTAHLDDYAYRI